ncbi:RNA polymerase II degradation factor 1-like [Lactuca sativa]|uniref:RNA polymerase II degradation factor 1-like n=1 Tax=Lactuca sativa TaxID=4236 RepID=UPI000CD99B64|nr:RNA polymerase II degradation factor 1-like [Lactuca sativa]
MDPNQNASPIPNTPNTTNDPYANLSYMQLITSPIHQQTSFTNLSYHVHYYQQQRAQQFNQPQFQALQQQLYQQFQPQSSQPQQFQAQPSQPSQVSLSQSQPINIDNDDERVQETQQPSQRRRQKGKAPKKNYAIEQKRGGNFSESLDFHIARQTSQQHAIGSMFLESYLRPLARAIMKGNMSNVRRGQCKIV